MDQEKINAFNEEQQRLKDEQAATDVQANQAERIARSVTNSGSAVAGVVSGAGARNEKATKEVGNTVSQVGHDIVEAVSQSQNEVAQALNNLVVATVVSKDPQLIQAAKDVAGLLTAVAQAGSDFKGSKLNLLPVANEKLAASIDKLASSVQEAPDKDYSPQLADILAQLKKLDTKPVINVPKSVVSVDLSPLLDAINELKKTVKDTAVEIPVDDDTNVVMGLQAVKQSLDNLVFPVANYVLPFKSSTGKATQLGLSDVGSLPITNVNATFRSGFAASGVQPDPTDWTSSNDTAGVASTDHLVTQGGNSSGSSYLRISLSPFVDGSEVSLTSVLNFSIPIWPRFGISISQRVIGQEVYAGLISVDSNSAIETTAISADLAITGATITIAANIGTVTLTNHGLNGGDRVVFYGCAEPRLNVGPVVVTPVDVNTFTVPITLANGSYSTTGGFVRYVDPLALTAPGQGTAGTAANNGGGFLFENATVTNASFVARRNGAKFRSLNSTVGTTTASQTNTAPFTDALNAAANNELLLTSAEFSFRGFTSDSVVTPSGLNKYTQSLPDESKSYKIRIRARNLKGLTMPVARITNISKTGSTTATVTTDVAHGLTTNSQIQIYGVLNQTDFPNLTAQTAVASVIDATNFTVVMGATIPTVSSLGGTVFSVQGSTLAPGAFTQVVQSISCASNVISVVGSGTWATPLPGEYVQVWGMQSGAGTYDGAYKVLGVSTTTLWLAAPGVADFGSISTGGAVMRRTDVRLHFVQVLDYNPLIIEGGRGNSTDINNAVPVSVTGGTLTTASTVTTVTTVTNQSQMSGFVIKDTLMNSQDRTAWANTIRARIT